MALMNNRQHKGNRHMGKAKNLGAIEEFVFPHVATGGVGVFQGEQGAGKSTILAGIAAIASGETKGPKLPIRDRAKSAEIEAFGMTLKVSARTTRTGEPEVTWIEGKFSLNDLVDPGIANPEAADARRIKALIQISGVEPDIALFERVLSETGVEALSPEAMEAPDLVAMCERVKRDLESHARKVEGIAENARGRVQALKKASETDEAPIPPEITPDAAQGQLEAALGALGGVRAKIEADKKRWEAAAKARDAQQKAAAAWRGVSVEAAQKAYKQAKRQAEARGKMVAELKAELELAESELKKADDRAYQFERDLTASEAHEALMASWKKTIEDGEDCPDSPNDQSLEDAQEEVDRARKLVAAVAIRDKMAEQIAEAKEQAKVAADSERQAIKLRDAARATDDVLSDAVGRLGTGLRVEGGRLVLDTDRKQSEHFAELSKGERAKVVLTIAVNQAAALSTDGRMGIFVIPQEMWEGLQPLNRQWVADLCRERKVMAYTGLVTDEPGLTCKVI